MTADPVNQPPPDLGILLVHGIGEQKQGETLNEFGAPIIKWLSQWLQPDVAVQRLTGNLARHVATKDFEGTAEFTSGILRPPDLPMGTPAHASATIAKRQGTTVIARQKWLFAESWWSPQTLTPRVSPFLLWLITRGPWILLLHLSQAFGVDYRSMSDRMTNPPPNQTGWEKARLYWSMLKFTFVTVVWLLLALVVISLWCVVSLIALVPIGYVRKTVYDVLLTITGVIGDSFVLINDPIQRVTFVETTRRALKWLQAQGCRRIAVVAHSQGAAIARDVLMESNAPRADLFVTLGPGLAKLDALAARERSAPSDFMWSGAAAPLVLLAVISFIRLSVAGHTGFALWGFPIFASILAATAIFRSWHSTADSLEWLKPDALKVALWRKYQPAMRWRDFYASHDPVSNGSLSTTVAASWRRVISRKVMVLASSLQDHTSYWTSRADFIPRVAQALDRCAGASLFATAAGMNRIRKARASFTLCVRLLSALRWLGWAALVIPLAQFRRVQAAADGFLTWITELDINSVTGVVKGVESALAWIGTRIAGQPVTGEAATALMVLALVTATILHVWGRIVTYWWGHMSALSLTPVFTPSRKVTARIAQGLLALLVTALGVLPLVLSVGWTFVPGSITWNNLDAFLTQFAKLTAIVLYIGTLVALVFMTRVYAQQLQAAYRTHGTLRKAVAQVADLWALAVMWAFCAGVTWWLVLVLV